MDWATLIIAAIVAAVFIAIIVSAVRARKNGKPVCPCGNCKNCPGAGLCHRRSGE